MQAVGVGEHLQELAAVQHIDELKLFLIIIDHVCQLFLPIFGIEEPAAENLLRSEALIAGFAAHLGGEILGQRLHRAYAAFIHHIHLPHLVCALLGQRIRLVGSLHGHGAAECDEGKQQGRFGGRLLQQAAELTVWGEKQSRQGEEQQNVSAVGESDAPWVVGHRKHRIALIVIIILVKTIVPVLQDVVHGNFGIRGTLLVGDLEIAYKVHRGVRAGVGLYLKMIESEREG